MSPLKGMQRTAYVALSTDSLLDYTEEVSSWPRLWCNRQENMFQPATLSSASPRGAGVNLHREHWACLYLLQTFPLDGHSTVLTSTPPGRRLSIISWLRLPNVSAASIKGALNREMPVKNKCCQFSSCPCVSLSLAPWDVFHDDSKAWKTWLMERKGEHVLFFRMNHESSFLTYLEHTKAANQQGAAYWDVSLVTNPGMRSLQQAKQVYF